MTNRPTNSVAAWWTPSPGPIAVLTPPNQSANLARTLRGLVSRHDDTAWVHPRPPAPRDTLTNFGQDLLDALGTVGLNQPRTYGEAHLLRPLVELVHGPVRHLVVDDAAMLDTDVLTELHQAALVAHAQVWLLIDTSDRPATPAGGHARTHQDNGLLAWVNAVCTPITPDVAEHTWAARHPAEPDCPLPAPAWWHQPLDPTASLPEGCGSTHGYPHPGRIPCLLAWVRRATTAGHLAPAAARARLNEYLTHPDATVADHWAMTPARREHYTGTEDALHQLHIDGTDLRLADVSPDGQSIHHASDRTAHVPAHMAAAVTRLRTSRTLAGCLDHESLSGLFDETPGLRRRRRRPARLT